VIQLAIDPPLHDTLDVRKVRHHVAAIQSISPDIYLDDGVVPVRVLADAVVIEQPVTVAEVDALGN
jgi:hypothetical protein